MKRKGFEELLRGLANNPGQCLSRYPRLFAGDADPEQTVGVLRLLLCLAWRANNHRDREWWCHGIATYYHRDRVDRDLKESLGAEMAKGLLGDAIEPGSFLFALQKPPRRPTVLEDALLYFKANARSADLCANPACPAPYYFRRKKNQKFCSPVCAKPTQQAAKRQWWRVNRGKSTSKVRNKYSGSARTKPR